MKAVRAIVSGRVQGVGFRYSAQRKAKSFGLRGYVRNKVDGSVEAFAEGEKGDVDAYLKWLKKGPSSAVVRDVKVQEFPYEGLYKGFDIAF